MATTTGKETFNGGLTSLKMLRLRGYGGHWNMVADKLSKEQIPNQNLFYCYHYIPRFVTTMLYNDYVISSH